MQYNTEWDKKETLVVPNAERKKKIKAYLSTIFTKKVCNKTVTYLLALGE